MAKLSRPIKLKISLYSLITLIVGGVLIYFFRFSGLSPTDFYISPFFRPDSLTIPPRPGTSGIILSGPILKDLKFEINTSAAGLRQVDWNRLIAIDRTAVVTVRAFIEANGQLRFSRKDRNITDSGHPDAGRYIEQVLSTWVYTTYKYGAIRFYFNVASTGKSLTIDASDMQMSNPSGNPVVDGRLHYVTGLSAGQVGYGTVNR
jgi:hypothetical protein